MLLNDDSIVAAIESDAEIYPVAMAHNVVPAKPGFYSIFVDNAENVPKPFNQILCEKKTQLLYIGVASVSLYERLIEQDLRHKSPSTFFRGIGAILGFRPPVGSLVGKGNQNNYKFSLSDTTAIDDWNRNHLSVRFIVADTAAFPHAEKWAIVRNCPILNTVHNPGRVKELAELRNLCRSIGCRTNT